MADTGLAGVGDSSSPLSDVGAPPPALNPLARHAAFAVDDYAEARGELQAHGLEVFESAKAGQMWVRDPDGHIIELIVAKR